MKENQQTRIFIIDDEEIVLQSIKAFLELESDYQVHTYLSPREALQAMNDFSPDLVISDFLMPEMNGIEFLHQVKKMDSDLPCILLTAYADKENAIKAINEVGIFQFVEKPWDNDQLLLIIRNGIATKSLRVSLREKIHELDELNRQTEDLFQTNNLLQREIFLARRVHDKILPRKNFKKDNVSIHIKYLPAFEIGGDFYDFSAVSDEKMLITLADLTGHGIQAALCTALLKFALNYHNHQQSSLENIMAGINDILFRGLPSDIFAAVILVQLDKNKKTCEILNAGIPYPFHQIRKSKTTQAVVVSGLVPGMVSNDSYKIGERAKIQLDSGDRLLLITDGLSEIHDARGKLFGEVVLPKLLEQHIHLASPELLDLMVQRAFEFSEDKKNGDDLTIVCIDLD